MFSPHYFRQLCLGVLIVAVAGLVRLLLWLIVG